MNPALNKFYTATDTGMIAHRKSAAMKHVGQLTECRSMSMLGFKLRLVIDAESVRRRFFDKHQHLVYRCWILSCVQRSIMTGIGRECI